MKISELDASRMTIEEKYELIMHGIKDYAREDVSMETKTDFLIVLGCRPGPLKARIIKAAELYKKGYAKYLLFSGGHGWNRNVEAKSAKDEKMIEDVKQIVKPQLIGESLSESEMLIRNKMKMTKEEANEEIDCKIRNLSECQLMTRMMISLGDVPGDNIFHEPFSNNTIENIKFTGALFKSIVKNGRVPEINRVMLITSSFHCRRAMLTFMKYFKDYKILACPTTLDFKERNINFCKEDMIRDEYYRAQIENEVNAIINYSRKGFIEDCDISEILGEKLAKKMSEKYESKEI